MGVSLSWAPSALSAPSSTMLRSSHCYSPVSRALSNPKLGRSLKEFRRRSGGGQCYRCSVGTPGPGSRDNDSKTVLDAFFLGKALAEVLNERIGATVGEILSVVGQWQAEQQKQVEDFQEDVIERAKRAKEKAAIEAVEVRGMSKSLTKPPETPSASPPSSGPTTEDPLQEMLKD